MRWVWGGLALLLAACAPVVAQERPQPPRAGGWALERSDLPQDPDVSLGVLGNGMRWLVLPHGQPEGAYAIRLVIDAGSMQEREGEEGAAHFLEHMAFRGTTRFPDGELQRLAEQFGMQLGEDLNATTGPDQTIFKLNVPRNDGVALQAGLGMARDLASAMVLDPAAMQVERGVVLAEERMREGPGLRFVEQQMKDRVGSHPYARSPIGKRNIVETMTAQTLRGFYDAYYRPERATLVVVGDLEPAAARAAIEAAFGDWIGRGEAGGDPKPVVQRPPAPEIGVNVIPGVGDVSLYLEWFEPYREIGPTKAERRRLLVEQLGAQAAGLRMSGINEAAGRPARLATHASPSRLPRVWSGSVGQAAGVSDLQKTIDLMVAAHRSVAQFGIGEGELERVKGLRLDAARQAAEQGRTGRSEDLAQSIAERLTSEPTFVSPEDGLKLLEEQIAGVTLAEVNAALKARLSARPRLSYYGPVAPEGGQAALKAMFDRAMAAPATAYRMEAVKPWAYTDFGAPGKIAERREVADLGVTFVRFENGVRLTVKPTQIQKQDVLVRVRLGKGRLALPKDRIDHSDMGEPIWQTGGLGKMTRTEIARALAGKRTAANISSGEDAFEIDNGGGGVTIASQLGLQLERMAAMVSDPGLRTDEWDNLIRASDEAEEAAPFTPGGVMSMKVPALLHAGDLRWVINTKEMRRTWKPEASLAFIRPIILNSPLEVIIVGDVKVEDAISEAARTFGALPKREETPEPVGLRDVKFPAGTPTPVKLTHKGRADQAAMIIAWPTQGLLKDPKAYRTAYIVSQLLQARATIVFRSEQGATYSPTSEAAFSRELPDYGYIALAVEIPPERIAGAFAEVERLAKELAVTLPHREELSRVLKVRAEQVRREAASSNAYWAAGLANADRDPRVLEMLRTQVGDYEGITAEDVRDSAARWLRPETAFKVMVVGE